MNDLILVLALRGMAYPAHVQVGGTMNMVLKGETTLYELLIWLMSC